MVCSEALRSSVLVLNRSYVAIHVVGVRRAFGLLLRQCAEVIHHEEGTFANYDFQSWREISELRSENKLPHDDWIRAVNFEIQAPRVIRLMSCDRMPTQRLRPNRQAVFARDEHRCQYCGHRFPASHLSLDHVIPRSRGGRTTWENMVCACVKCNMKKGGRTPREARMKLIRKPVRPTNSPLLALKLQDPRYRAWRIWVNSRIREEEREETVPGTSNAAPIAGSARNARGVRQHARALHASRP